MTAEKPKRVAGPRLQHVIARTVAASSNSSTTKFDEVLVFGQEIDALRAIIGKPDWVYAAVAHGQSFTEALKAAQA